MTRRSSSAQVALFDDTLQLTAPQGAVKNFPATRYQGSKLKILGWLWQQLEPLGFDSVADLFGGTGAVSYLFKVKGKRVHYNDCMRANFLIGKALIENPSVRLGRDELASLPGRREVQYDDFIERTFGRIYYTDEENRQLDVMAQNIEAMPDGYKKALAYYALFQACIAKRPYNLFHRANLYMREAKVERSFGNKATWDKSFADHMTKASLDANSAVFDNGRENVATCGDAAALDAKADLVYLDPPYISGKGVGLDYLGFYHFLEGLSEYRVWPQRIDAKYKHKPYKRGDNSWFHPAKITEAFDAVLDRWKDSILAVSYRSDGIPSAGDLKKILERHKRKVTIKEMEYKYALSTNSASREVLLIAE